MKTENSLVVKMQHIENHIRYYEYVSQNYEKLVAKIDDEIQDRMRYRETLRRHSDDAPEALLGLRAEFRKCKIKMDMESDSMQKFKKLVEKLKKAEFSVDEIKTLSEAIQK